MATHPISPPTSPSIVLPSTGDTACAFVPAAGSIEIGQALLVDLVRILARQAAAEAWALAGADHSPMESPS